MGRIRGVGSETGLIPGERPKKLDLPMKLEVFDARCALSPGGKCAP
jgi:hypothetical protein